MIINKENIRKGLKYILLGLISLIPGAIIALVVFGIVALFTGVTNSAGFLAGFLFLFALILFGIGLLTLILIGKFINLTMEQLDKSFNKEEKEQ